ncbi:MAG: hypothetical protein HYU58_02660 [Proteobacteria bacterium]|nr:hypothetical protein [Pseudomonadota bacterium]
MWPYNDDEQLWLEKNASQTQPIPQGQDYLPDYYRPEPARTVDFYRQRAHELRNEAIGQFFRSFADGATSLLQQLGAITSGNHGKVEAMINELRGARPRTAANAGR